MKAIGDNGNLYRLLMFPSLTLCAKREGVKPSLSVSSAETLMLRALPWTLEDEEFLWETDPLLL